jgi:hypothetical protein
MYNKFNKSNVSKLGSEIIRNGGGLTPIMEMGVMTAIPIWEMLNITEQLSYMRMYVRYGDEHIDSYRSLVPFGP